MNPYRMIPLPIALRERPSDAEIRRQLPHVPKNTKLQLVDTCSENSVLSWVGKSALLQDIRKAAQGSGCRVKPLLSWLGILQMPALLAIVDPTLVEPGDWAKVCEVFHDATPENVKFLLTGLSPHSRTLPLHNVVPMPAVLDAASLQAVMRSLRDRPPAIVACAPYYPGTIAQMPREFMVAEFLKAFGQEHGELINNVANDYPHSSDVASTVIRLMAAQLYDFPTLVERVSCEQAIYLAPDGELKAKWRKK